MTTKLGLYNAALRLIGDRSLSSLTEAREPRYTLDEVYEGALGYCLGVGLWNFAMRAVEANDAPSITPTFGFQYAFTKPDDWVRTAGVFTNENESAPLTQYEDEGGYWYADVTPIYVRYVSNDNSYGMDIGKWPWTFTKFVEAHLAAEICERNSQNGSKHEVLRRLEKDRLRDAKSKDAMNESVRFPPPGLWVQSRGSGSGNRSRWNKQFV